MIKSLSELISFILLLFAGGLLICCSRLKEDVDSLKEQLKAKEAAA